MTDSEKFELWRDAFIVSLKGMLERGMSLKGPNPSVYYPTKEAGELADHALDHCKIDVNKKEQE